MNERLRRKRVDFFSLLSYSNDIKLYVSRIFLRFGVYYKLLLSIKTLPITIYLIFISFSICCTRTDLDFSDVFTPCDSK